MYNQLEKHHQTTSSKFIETVQTTEVKPIAFNQSEKPKSKSEQASKAKVKPIANVVRPHKSPNKSKQNGVTNVQVSAVTSESDIKQVAITMPASQDKKHLHPLDALFQATSVPSQFFTINSANENVLYGESGIMVNIPKACFVDKKGRKVKGDLSIEMKELLSLSDLLLSNVPTVSLTDFLQTKSVVYLAAKTIDGTILDVAPSKQIYIEMPTEKRKDKTWLCHGNYDEKGDLIWTTAKEQINELIPFPLAELKFDKAGLTEELYQKLTNPKYENTIIATREFEERLLYLQANKHVHGNRIAPILDFYFKNINASMLEIDYKLHRYFNKLLKVEPYQAGEYVKEIKAIAKRFKMYYDEKRAKPLPFYKTEGIDMRASDALKQLERSGLSTTEAQSLLQMYQFREAIIFERNNNDYFANYDAHKPIPRNTFYTGKTGWLTINERPNHHKYRRNLKVNFTNKADEGLAKSVFMVFKEIKTVIPAKYDAEEDVYHFSDLPNRESAYLIGLGQKNEQPYIDIVEMVVGKTKQTSLSLRGTTHEMLSYELDSRLN